MRCLFLVAAFVAWVLATCWLWTYRFERVPEIRSWSLDDLKPSTPVIPGLAWEDSKSGPILKLAVDSDHARVGVRLGIPGVVPANFLHLRYRMEAERLRAGAERWEDGRFMVDWHQVGSPGEIHSDPVGTIRDEIRGELQDIVVESDHPPAMPSLRVEHLGRSGAFRISELKIEIIRERWIWRVGKWILLAGWWLWAFLFVRSWQSATSLRSAVAACVWIAVGFQFVVPGPWKIQRPIFHGFQLGTETPHPTSSKPQSRQAPSEERQQGSSPQSGALKPLGELPIQGSYALKLKLTIQQARPVLHMLLLFTPMLAMTLLVGARPAAGLSVIAAVAIEAAQIAFGYGFGWDDVGDLVCDGAGIILAVRVSKLLLGFASKCLRSRSNSNGDVCPTS